MIKKIKKKLLKEPVNVNDINIVSESDIAT